MIEQLFDHVTLIKRNADQLVQGAQPITTLTGCYVGKLQVVHTPHIVIHNAPRLYRFKDDQQVLITNLTKQL